LQQGSNLMMFHDDISRLFSIILMLPYHGAYTSSGRYFLLFFLILAGRSSS